MSASGNMNILATDHEWAKYYVSCRDDFGKAVDNIVAKFPDPALLTAAALAFVNICSGIANEKVAATVKKLAINAFERRGIDLKKICFAVERFADAYEEASPLLMLHWEEIAKNEQLLQLNPDKDVYERLGDNALLITARSDGRLIGYFVWFLVQHPHYKHVTVAEEDLHFLLPEHRRGLAGYSLVKAACNAALERGAELLIMREKIGHEHPAIMKRLGFAPTDNRIHAHCSGRTLMGIATAASATSIASMGVSAAGSIMGGNAQASAAKAQGQAQQQADIYRAEQLDRSAVYGKLQSVQAGGQMARNLNQTLGNIDAIRAAARTDPSSPTGQAVRQHVEDVGTEQSTIKVTSLLAQAQQDTADAAYMRYAGNVALLTGGAAASSARTAGYISAGAGLLKGISGGLGGGGGSAPMQLTGANY